MHSDLENFYLKLEEPNQSCFLFLRTLILDLDDRITETWKYKLPFFDCNNKMFCYLWLDKKTKYPYIGIARGNQIEHPLLIQGNRKRMKILTVNPNEDIPVDLIKEVLNLALETYN